MAGRICREPSACSRTAVVTWVVALFMWDTVCSTSAEAWDCLAVAGAIWPMSWLERRHRLDDAAQREPRLVGEGDALLGLARPPPWRRPPRPRCPVCTWRTTSPISLAASTERSASFLTSSATTANPRPASPARAASMAAFRARRFVWSAISSMTSRILPISCERLPEAGDDARGVLHGLGDGLHARDGPADRLVAGARVVGGACWLMRSASSAILATSVTARRHARTR